MARDRGAVQRVPARQFVVLNHDSHERLPSRPYGPGIPPWAETPSADRCRTCGCADPPPANLSAGRGISASRHSPHGAETAREIRPPAQASRISTGAGSRGCGNSAAWPGSAPGSRRSARQARRSPRPRASAPGRLPVRWNRDMPSRLSSRFSCALTPGWEIPRRRAVSMVVPTRINVPKSSISRRFMITPVIEDGIRIIITNGFGLSNVT